MSRCVLGGIVLRLDDGVLRRSDSDVGYFVLLCRAFGTSVHLASDFNSLATTILDGVLTIAESATLRLTSTRRVMFFPSLDHNTVTSRFWGSDFLAKVTSKHAKFRASTKNAGVTTKRDEPQDRTRQSVEPQGWATRGGQTSDATRRAMSAVSHLSVCRPTSVRHRVRRRHHRRRHAFRAGELH